MSDSLKQPGGEGEAGRDFDACLLSGLKSGDENAFQYVHKRLNAPLFNLTRKMTGSAQDAEDICQEVFTTLWLKREQIDETKNLKSYIFGIARRVTWSYLRDNRRNEMFYADACAETAGGLSPDEVIQSKETDLLIRCAIDRLPARTREIYRLHFYDNLSHKQIADRMGISPENIRAQIYQARKKVQEIGLALIISYFLTP